jgi:hypothetical protein
MTRRYCAVSVGTIPEIDRRAAAAALRWAAADLELVAPPTIAWFTDRHDGSLSMGNLPPTPPGDFDHAAGVVGRTNGDGLVWVRAYMGPRKTAEIVLHEALHHFQHQLAGVPLGDLERAGRERMALDYQSEMAGIAAAIAATAAP